MLNALPSILTAAAPAANVAVSGTAARRDSDAGTDFSRLMQQQADLRQSDLRQSDQRLAQQRLAQQRLETGRSPEPHPVAPATAAPAQPAETRPATAATPVNAKPPSAAAGPAPSPDGADKASAASAQDDRGFSQADSRAAGNRGAARQNVNANLARARHAALAGSQPAAADGAAVRGGAQKPGSRHGDSETTPDPVDGRSFGGPVPAPDSSPAGALPSPASALSPAADLMGAAGVSVDTLSATAPTAALPAGTGDAASTVSVARAANAAAVAGTDFLGRSGPGALADRATEIRRDDGVPGAARSDTANRDTRRPDRPGSATARLESPAQTPPTAPAPHAAAAAALQTAAGADPQPRPGGDSASTTPAVFGIGTAQSAMPTVGLASTPAAAGAVEARIAVPVDSPAFAPALGAQISLFAQGGVQTAQLQLNPADMGPITVQIALDGNDARVDFQADRAATRELIEASLPALAGAMQDAGLTLSGGGVFQQHPGRQPAPDHSPTTHAQRSGPRDTRPDNGAADLASASRRGRLRGLVDLVA
jgi:flagellar hook-length control protein FliK